MNENRYDRDQRPTDVTTGGPAAYGPSYGSEPTAQYTHRYGQTAPEHTQHLSYPGAGGPGDGYTPSTPATTRKRGTGLLVSAALVAGLVGGVGGAAAMNAFDDDPSETSNVAGTSLAESVSTKDKQLDEGTIEAVAEKVLPSVVQINVTGSASASGTGIIISEDGEVLTNNHVIESAAESGTISVSFNDGSIDQAKIVGRDPVTDLAVIKATDTSGLTPATLGSSSDLNVGQDVVAVGSPFGLESTVTSGIVSALNRPVESGDGTGGTSNVFPAVQTDAAINPGNSGGPLVDLNGNVIGINTAIRSSSASAGEAGSIGLGFAIPVDLARNIAAQLVDGKTVEHARIGISVSDPTESDGVTSNGAKVESVESGSAGADAGLRKGDVITMLNDDRVSGSSSLVATIRGYAPGDKIELEFSRDGDTKKVDVTLDSDGGELAP